MTAGAEPLRLRAERRRIGEDVVKGVLALCALVSVVTTVGIVLALFQPAIEFFRDVYERTMTALLGDRIAAVA